MRDPERIPAVLEFVERLWRKHPDWRLGQLISNVASWRNQDVWDLEEDELVAEIERHIHQAEATAQSGK